MAYAIKTLKPSVRVIGVEAEGAASMTKSRENDQIERLGGVLTIADGIAVKEPGKICLQHLAKGGYFLLFWHTNAAFSLLSR